MHTEKREDPLVELGYEVRDLNTVAIRNATIGFFIFAIGSAVIGFACYRVMNPTVFEPQSANNRVVPTPPNPLIQSNMAAKTDIMDVRQHETEVLTAPIGWTDSTKTHVHMPIEEAMKIIATRGAKPTGASVPAVSLGHTPNPAIGEKPAAPKSGTVPATVTVTGGSSSGPSSSTAARPADNPPAPARFIMGSRIRRGGPPANTPQTPPGQKKN